MRVMFGCSMGGSGHLLPLLEVLRAGQRLGHDCVLLVPPSLAEAAPPDVRVVVGRQPSPEIVQELWAQVRAGPPDRVVGLIDRELFAGSAADVMRADARALCTRYAPDLVIREPCEYASAMAAHEAGVAQAQVGISLSAIEEAVLADVAADLDRRCAGVAQTIRAAPYLTAFPEALDPSSHPDTRRYRLTDAPPAALPDWWGASDDRPLVYVTFGSVLGRLAEAAGVYRTALDAVSELEVRVLMTTGSFPAETLTPPSNVRIERWVAQADVLAVADLVVCHAGSGTTLAALAAGLPLVVCPLFADQTRNAALVERIGAGVVVRSRAAPTGGIAGLRPADSVVLAEAIRRCLTEPGHRLAARRIAETVAATPTIDDVAGALVSRVRRSQARSS